MPLVLAARFYNSFDAGAAQGALAAADIHSVLFDTEMAWEAFGGVIPIRLMVLDDDEAAARAILAQGAPGG